MKSSHSLIDLLLIVVSLIVILAGCGPKRVRVYPIIGCDYWPTNGRSFYVAGPTPTELQAFTKQCYYLKPDGHLLFR